MESAEIVPGYVTRSNTAARQALAQGRVTQDHQLLLRHLQVEAVGWYVWSDPRGGIHTKRRETA